MPQMAPMNWIILYMIFSMTFLLFNFYNYYMFLIKTSPSMILNFMKNNMNWKW